MYIGSKNRSKSKICPLIHDSGNVTATGQDMAHEFNKFFTTVFTKENLLSVPEIPSIFWQYGRLSDVHVDNSAVMKKLDKLRQDKAPGADDIQPHYRKEIAEEVCYALTTILCKSLDQGEIPRGLEKCQ